MNDTLNLSRRICPEFIQYAGLLIRDQYPRNLTFNDKYTELATYGCQFGYLMDILNRNNRYGAIAKWIAFICGLFGSIAALLTFTRKEYANCVTMIYHRSINAIEVFTSVLTLRAALHSFYGDQLMKYQTWAYLSVYVAEKMHNCLFLWVNLIVLWVAIERTLACRYARLFDAINRKSVATIVIAVAGLAGLAMFLPYGFSIDLIYDDKTKSYKIVKSAWAQATNGGYKAYSLAISITVIIHAVSLLSAALAALTGFVTLTKRKRALIIVCGGNRSDASRQLLKQCSMNIQLCILQMCETVPCVANELLFVYVIIRYDLASPFKGTAATAPQIMTYAEARRNADMMVPYLCLVMINGIGALISHYSRFYWYLIFSPRIRSNFRALLTWRRKHVISSSNVQMITVRSQTNATTSHF